MSGIRVRTLSFTKLNTLIVATYINIKVFQFLHLVSSSESFYSADSTIVRSLLHNTNFKVQIMKFLLCFKLDGI